MLENTNISWVTEYEKIRKYCDQLEAEIIDLKASLLKTNTQVK